jgi:hypothetical protein
MYHQSAAGISFNFDPLGGFIRDFTVQDGGQIIAPLHVAPWVMSGEALDPDTPLHLTRLAGDFFCAPFAKSADGSPMHGWPANGTWAVQPGPGLRAVLDHMVSGAGLVKELVLHDGHPFLYQRHIFGGGTGLIPVANHAMVSLPHGGILRFSPKRWFESAATPPEPDVSRGRSALAYPARHNDPHTFPLAAGGTVDLAKYPFGPAQEEFVVGVEAPGHALGWTAVTRPATGDLYLSLRHAQKLPMTMLWHSNGGRDYAPWSGRHLGCLGVEEGAALPMLGFGATETPDPLTSVGQNAGLTLHPEHTAEVRHVIGAIAWPSAEPVQSVVASGDSLIIKGEGGAIRQVPFDAAFLADS